MCLMQCLHGSGQLNTTHSKVLPNDDSPTIAERVEGHAAVNTWDTITINY